MAHKIPKFSELPLDKSGPRAEFSRYGKDDQLGTLNRLTDDIVKAASSEIQTGIRIGLDWPLDAQKDIPLFVGYQKEALFYNNTTLDQIHGTNGTPQTNTLGIGAWAARGIVGRGILLDYHAWRLAQTPTPHHNAFETGSITVADLKNVAASQKTEIRFGDVLLVRSGYMEAYASLSRSEIETFRAKQPLTFTGVEQSEEMMEFLWSNFSAAGGDHPSWEAWPTRESYALHEVMLGGWGMPIGELFDLEALGKHCREVGRWSFFLTSEPVNVPGGVASPPNALAIF
ncbi:hypothetical protein LTS16_012413 [Friedmanniomyces endolithicus]|nr:hypothetical protein LTS16_012413 [Friedmanniomyces endolithicus]